MSEQPLSSNLGEVSSQMIHDAITAAMISASDFTSITETETIVAAVAVGDAAKNKDWPTFEKFLSDESNLVLNEKYLDLALGHGAPVSLIKRLVEIEGTDMISKGQCSWLHTAMMNHNTTFEVVKLLVDIGGKDLVLMQSDHPEHRKRTALHIHLGLSMVDTKSVERNHKIIELLVRIGGVELLEIEDEDGYRIVDYSVEDERTVMINCLINTDDARILSTQKYMKTLQSLLVKVTPKDFYCWIDSFDIDKVKNYLENEEVSREAKQRCFNYRDSDYNRDVFCVFCMLHGPVDIAEQIIDLMGIDFLMTTDKYGDTCLHYACANCDDDDDTEFQHMLVEFLLDQGGPALLSATNNHGETALHILLSCDKMNFDSITLMVDIGDKDFLLKKDRYGCTVLHKASHNEEPNKDIILYLISKGGSDLRESKDCDGEKAEDYWSPELKEYIDLHTKTSPDLPPLSDDLQCPICFEIMDDVHIIPQCCHRFCKKCIADAFNCNSKKCPVCRMEYSIGEVRRDPLLCKFAMLTQDKENELKKVNEKNEKICVLLEEKEGKLTKAKEDNKILTEELVMLKRKYNEM